jgi:hypothetical protein
MYYNSFRLVIVNQRDPRNLVEDITPLWEVSSEKNYLFFRVPLNSKVDTHPSDPKVCLNFGINNWRIVYWFFSG